MYKLYIEINSVWKIVDLGDDKPAMNKQANDIAELKDRQVDYSQSLKLPQTRNNCQLFGFSESVDVVTDFPYKKHKCRLFSNDSVVAGIGSYLVLTKVNEYFEVQILSSNADFFSILESKKVSELDLGSCKRSGYGFFDDYAVSNDKGWCMAAAIYTKGEQITPNNAGGNQYPFVFIKYVIDKILQSNGYEPLITNVPLIEMSKKAINISTLIPDANSLLIYNSSATWKLIRRTDGSGSNIIGIVSNGNGMLASADTPLRLIYSSPAACKFNVNLTVVGSGDPMGMQTFEIKNGTTDEVILTDTFILLGGQETHTVTKQVELGDLEDAVITITANTQPLKAYNFDNVITITNLISDVVPLTGMIPLAPNLGFDTQLDFFKMFTQLFGLTVQVNNETKTVYAYTMQKLYDNKSLAKDWSEKLHDKKNDKSFTIRSYGQSNYIKLDDNEIDNVKDKGVFTIQNETLPLEKDLFNIKLEAGNDATSMGVSVASIPLEEVTIDGEITTREFKDGKPHIVEITNGQVMFLGTLLNAKLANHATAQSFVNNYYARLIDMLYRAKWIDEEFWLTDEDIEKFDHFVPVYVQKYGAFFYVNKIKNYISGQLTKCEIIKL